MKAVVLSDRLGYVDDDGAVQRALKGDTVDLSEADFKRHAEHGSVAKPGKAAKEALAGDESAEEPEPDASAE